MQGSSHTNIFTISPWFQQDHSPSIFPDKYVSFQEHHMTLEKQLKVSRAFRFSGLLMRHWRWGSAKIIWVWWIFAMEGILVLFRIKKLEKWYWVLHQLSDFIFKMTLYNKGNQEGQLNFVGRFVFPQLGGEMHEPGIETRKCNLFL